MGQKKTKKTLNQGFSLPELAICLVIVGILMTGSIKGKTLVDQARLSKVVQQIQCYQMAFSTFVERYNSPPGDFSRASTFFPNATNGDGDGIISGNGLDPNSEAFLFWSHLSSAHLIFDVISQKQTPPTPQFGVDAPSSPLGGGFTVAHTPQARVAGHWLVLGNKKNDKGDGGLLTPHQAFLINRRLDNGHGTTGSVQSAEGNGEEKGCCLNEDGSYNFKSKKKCCVLYVGLNVGGGDE